MLFPTSFFEVSGGGAPPAPSNPCDHPSITPGPSLTADSWYDNDTASWPIAKMTTPRFGAGAAACGGKIYIVGGRGGPSGTAYLDTVEVFDPVANTCTVLTTMPEPRYYCGVEAYDGKLYVLKGYDGAFYNNDVLIYDIAGDSWSTGSTDNPVMGSFYSALDTTTGKIYTMPGDPDFNTTYGYVDEYDTSTDTWTMLAGYPSTHGSFFHGPAAAYYDGYIFSVGGNSMYKTSQNDLYRYDISTNGWLTMASAPRNIERTAFVTVNDKIYLGMGYYGSIHTEISEYDPNTNTWDDTLTPAPTGFFIVDAVSLYDVVYYIGGRNNDGAPYTTDYITAYVTPQGANRPY